MTNNYILVNPKVGDFIRRQKGTNVLLGFGIAGLAIGSLTVLNKIIALENRIAHLENTLKELGCETGN